MNRYVKLACVVCKKCHRAGTSSDTDGGAYDEENEISEGLKERGTHTEIVARYDRIYFKRSIGAITSKSYRSENGQHHVVVPFFSAELDCNIEVTKPESRVTP